MMTNDQPFLRVVYFSRPRLDGLKHTLEWEIDAILEKSRANNARSDVTGALVFNSGVFAQVLEGPVEAVEETFERIQMDTRHDDITVLDSEMVPSRAFADWSMGFVGIDARSAEIYDYVAEKSRFDISQLSGQEIFELLRRLALTNEPLSRAG